jgi:hypothetical protein
VAWWIWYRYFRQASSTDITSCLSEHGGIAAGALLCSLRSFNERCDVGVDDCQGLMGGRDEGCNSDDVVRVRGCPVRRTVITFTTIHSQAPPEQPHHTQQLSDYRLSNRSLSNPLSSQDLSKFPTASNYQPQCLPTCSALVTPTRSSSPLLPRRASRRAWSTTDKSCSRASATSRKCGSTIGLTPY